MLPRLAALHRRGSSTADAFISTLHLYHISNPGSLGGGDIDDKTTSTSAPVTAAPQPDSVEYLLLKHVNTALRITSPADALAGLPCMCSPVFDFRICESAVVIWESSADT